MKKKLIVLLSIVSILLMGCQEVKESAVKDTLVPYKIEIEPVEVTESTEEYEAKIREENNHGETMEVHFLDVGQGDSIFIKVGSDAMLIDAGDNSQGTYVQNYLRKQDIDNIDYFVMTHPDADHIGGADVIITKFDIDTILMPEYEKDTRTYEDVINAMEYKGIKPTSPKAGDSFFLGEVEFTVLAPVENHESANNNSIVLLAEYGEDSFLFMGDCEEEEEQDIMKSQISYDVDVIKIGHHGSKTSSTETFIKNANPDFAVISCGEGNDYGHPHAATLNTLRTNGVKLFRTDEQGVIIVETKGDGFIWNCSPTDSWKAGE